MRRIVLTVIAVLLLASPASAYPLHHPHHERCRRGYVRHKRHARVFCDRATHPASSPARPSAPAPASAPAAPRSGVTSTAFSEEGPLMNAQEEREAEEQGQREYVVPERTCAEWAEWMRQQGYTPAEIAEYAEAEGADCAG